VITILENKILPFVNTEILEFFQTRSPEFLTYRNTFEVM